MDRDEYARPTHARRHRSRRLAGLALVVASLAAACGSDGDTDEGATTEPAGAVTTSTPSGSASPGQPCTPDSADPTELEALLTDDVPDDFVVQPDAVGDTGPSDLAKAIRDDGEDDAASALAELGFRRGYQRLWIGADQDQLLVFVYEFCDEAGADGYLRRTDEGLGTDVDVERFDPEVEGATFAYRAVPDAVPFAVIPAVQGPFLVLAVSSGPAGTRPVDDHVDRASALLTSQLSLL